MPHNEDNQPRKGRFDDVLETAPFTIYEIDYKIPRFIRVNQATCELSGYTEQELLSMNPVDWLEPESAERFKDRIKRGLAGQKIDELVEFRFKAKDGHYIWVILRVKPTYKDGKLDSALVFGYDVTERKKAEETANRLSLIQKGANMILEAALKSTREQLGIVCLKVAEEITQSKFGLISEINPEGLQDIAISNPGWDACKVITEQGHSRPPGNYEIRGIYGGVLRDGKGFYTNDPSTHPDRIGLPNGHPPLQNFLGVPLKSEGKTIGMIAVANRAGGFREEDLAAVETLAPTIVDAFARKKAEEALKKLNDELELRVQERTKEITIEHERLFGVLDSLPLIISVLKPNRQFAFTNKMFRQVFGDPKNRQCYNYLFDDTVQCKRFEAYETLITGKAYYWRLECPNGAVFDVYNSPLRDIEGNNLVIEVDIDVTERLNTEKQLQKSERLAAIGATAGMVGHDIRNPLQAITGDLYLLKTELNSMPECQRKTDVSESLEDIEKNVDYINKIVADLQDYARAITPAPQEVDLGSLCESVLFKNGVPKSITVNCTIEDAVRVIVSDKDLLKRVLSNLTSNAVQAMPNGGALTVHACKNRNDVMITVEDTGVGIPEEIRDRLFTPMFTTKSKGQGFGLAVVKRMTEALGGTVTFTSQVGVGTTFIVRLPIQGKKR